MKLNFIKTLTAVFLFAIPQLGFGQIAPNLNSAADFAILAGTGISFATEYTTISDMDIGLHPGAMISITGTENLNHINGVILAADAPNDPQNRLPDAKQHLLDAYDDAAGRAPTYPAISGNQGGLTLAPGVYYSESSLAINSTPLTLDAQGDVNAVWIFQIGSTLTTTSGGDVILAGGAMANNVFWQVGSSATIGGTGFKGNILALEDITIDGGANLDGRALARNGFVSFTGAGSTMTQPAETPVVTEDDLSITKTANPQTFSRLGEEIEYTILVENVGVGTLNEITVEDDLTNETWLINLAPGASETLTTSYFITEDDILSRGSVDNVATAEVAGVTVRDNAVVEFTPPIPFSTWALVLGGVLIAGFVFFQFRRSTRLKSA